MLFLRRVGVTLGYLKKMGKGYSNSKTSHVEIDIDVPVHPLSQEIVVHKFLWVISAQHIQSRPFSLGMKPAKLESQKPERAVLR